MQLLDVSYVLKYLLNVYVIFIQGGSVCKMEYAQNDRTLKPTNIHYVRIETPTSNKTL